MTILSRVSQAQGVSDDIQKEEFQRDISKVNSGGEAAVREYSVLLLARALAVFEEVIILYNNSVRLCDED